MPPKLLTSHLEIIFDFVFFVEGVTSDPPGKVALMFGVYRAAQTDTVQVGIDTDSAGQILVSPERGGDPASQLELL